MNGTMKEENGYTEYEYRDMTVAGNMADVYEDNLANFGWQTESRLPCPAGKKGVLLRIKRDRKLRNKAELARLQRNFESAAAEICRLENSKTTGAMAAAFSIGILGTACMACSVFSYVNGRFASMVLLAVPAFAGWIFPYFCYVTLVRKKTCSVEPLIEVKYDEIGEIGRKAHSLLVLF